MKVTITQLDPAVVLSTQTHTRSKGCHLSDVLRDLEKVVAPRTSQVSQEELERYAALGFIFEHAFARSMASGGYRIPGEVSKDGITGTPDLVWYQKKRPYSILDTKVKWCSSRKLENLEREFWYEVTQNKCYCHMLGVTRGGLMMFFVNGNYKGMIPELVQVEMEFSERELQGTWQMVTRHAKKKGWIR